MGWVGGLFRGEGGVVLCEEEMEDRDVSASWLVSWVAASLGEVDRAEDSDVVLEAAECGPGGWRYVASCCSFAAAVPELLN